MYDCAVIKTAASHTALLSARILSKPLALHIADALLGAGVSSLIVSGAPFFPEVAGRFSSFTQLELPSAAASAVRSSNADITFIFSAPALVDAAALSELRSEALALGATVLMASGRALIYALPADTDPSLVDAALAGETAGFCIADSAASAGYALPVSCLNELARAEETLRLRVCDRHIRAGVQICGLMSVHISSDAEIGAGTEILPGTIIRGAARIGKNCSVGPYAVIDGATLADGVKVNASQVYGSKIGANTTVGPYAYIRPGCNVGEHCRIGDFVELKDSNIGNDTKVSHLTYVGEADVGERVNFGCGTVVSNYDGVYKHRTVIGDDVFIGGNTNLIAPVTLEAKSYTAAGTTITTTVPEGHLAIGRVRQENKPGWWDRMQKLKDKKAADPK